MSGDQGEKKHPATQTKLQRLRTRDGQIAQSRDFPAAVSLIAAFATLLGTWRSEVDQFHKIFSVFDTRYNSNFAFTASATISSGFDLLLRVAAPVSVVAALAYLLASLLDSRGFVLSPKRIAPDLNRLNPASNVKNVFGLQAWSQLAKTLTKATLFAAFVFFMSRQNLNSLFWSPTCGVSCVSNVAIYEILAVIFAALLIVLTMGFVDIFVSRALFKRQHRMTNEELKKEQKDQFGSPELRRERRRLRNESAQSPRVRGLGRATLIIEATFGGVGIAYERGSIDTPMLVSKLTGEEFARKRLEAIGKGVPIVANEELAVQLARLGKIGAPVPTALYHGVAHAIVKSGLHTSS
ncbi:MAG: EscU/YscU/HrcU family type III secretion system export apparatus switch protein [Beijerinckiaceae bacterium]